MSAALARTPRGKSSRRSILGVMRQYFMVLMMSYMSDTKPDVSTPLVKQVSLSTLSATMPDSAITPAALLRYSVCGKMSAQSLRKVRTCALKLPLTADSNARSASMLARSGTNTVCITDKFVLSTRLTTSVTYFAASLNVSVL